MALDGETSNPVPVLSGVMFANDCLLYRIIKSTEYTTKLQQGLNILSEWAWQLNFNVTKFAVIQCTRITHPTIHIIIH